MLLQRAEKMFASPDWAARVGRAKG